MRSSLFLFVAASLLMLTGMTAGCGSDPSSEERTRLAESAVVWREMKTADDGTYAYTRTFLSFGGFRYNTAFVVQDDVVVRRAYEEYDENDQLVASYEEEGDEVGSNPDGAPVYTIDELYKVCRDEVLTQAPEEHHILLAFRDDGVLDYCFYVPKNCADDCATGVDIESLDLNATL